MTPHQVLVAHQRTTEPDGCSCGWAELGGSFATHQLAELRRAGYAVVPIRSLVARRQLGVRVPRSGWGR